MVSTFVNRGIRSTGRLGMGLMDETDPVRLWSEHSDAEIEMIIRAVYRQVLGNAHVMESERLAVPESQLRRGELSVREFVRKVAKSDLYRTRFFENCSRYRAIELNFKHLLGRAPDQFEEMRDHSSILDEAGFEAEIDSYLDSDEYQQVFGESIVPFYRGYKTLVGQSPLEFINMLNLVRSASSSDKDLMSGNQARLTRSLLRSHVDGRSRDANDILAEVFQSTVQAAPAYVYPTYAAPDQTLQRRYQEQETQIATLQRQLADLKPLANIGSAVTRQGQFLGETEPQSLTALSPVASVLERKVAEQQSQIDSLNQQIAEARSLAAVGEARLNKWRQRTFF